MRKLAVGIALTFGLLASCLAQLSFLEWLQETHSVDLSGLDDWHREVQYRYAYRNAQRKQLAECGKCDQRKQLEALAEAADRDLRQLTAPMCRAITGLDFGMPGARPGLSDAMGGLTGTGPICKALAQEDSEAGVKQAMTELEARAGSGRAEDLYALAQFHEVQAVSNRSDRRAADPHSAAACALYATLARKGDLWGLFGATNTTTCGRLMSANDRKAVVVALRACSDNRQSPECDSRLGWFHSSLLRVDNPSWAAAWTPFVKLDDKEALRLLERAATSGHSDAVQWALRLRASLGSPPGQGPARPEDSANYASGPQHLVTPTIYDNAASGFGQTFTAEYGLVAGVRFYIGDPGRPADPQVNALEGKTELVLFAAADLARPVELARTKVQEANGRALGLQTFMFSTPVRVEVGKPYFITLLTADLRFGLGLRSAQQSTYEGGSQAQLKADGRIVVTPNQRDTSFQILVAGPSANSR
ncbi:MAG: hypothetical protein KA169_03205 [Burkholderiaceae bacterium]|nr:hypothetical protein [Burkholderiaceae bacterium]